GAGRCNATRANESEPERAHEKRARNPPLRQTPPGSVALSGAAIQGTAIIAILPPGTGEIGRRIVDPGACLSTSPTGRTLEIDEPSLPRPNDASDSRATRS